MGNKTLSLSNAIRVRTLDLLRGTNQLKVYKKYIENQFRYSRQEIEAYQRAKFKEIFYFHYRHNTAYRRFVNGSGFNPEQSLVIQSVPLLTKDFFKTNEEDHSVAKEAVKMKRSGGSTGVPLTYYLSKGAFEGMWPSLWRAFQMYGVQPCDRTMMIAGPSLFGNRSFKRRIYDAINRFTVVSAFDLSEPALEQAYQRILKKRIEVIYGYTSSILIFLQFLKRHQYRINLKVIFTTSETFIPGVRSLAKQCCQCDVIDTYGANDGGVQAFECPSHTGYHLNFERCLVEVVNGEIVVTDLLNRASPFIRYRIGDYTSGQKVIKERCECGRMLFRLPDVSGRVNEYITDLDGEKIHPGFFRRLFGKEMHLQQFQIIQKEDRLCINVIHDEYLDKDRFVQEYAPFIEKRIKMTFRFEFNGEIKRYKNMKSPVFWKSESNK